MRYLTCDIKSINVITIKDVAKKAGVSVAAVSYAFNGIDKISEETRERIFAVSREMQYKPRTLPRKIITFAILSTQDNNIGLNSPYDAVIINTISRCLAKRNIIADIITMKNLEVMDLSIFNGIICICHDYRKIKHFFELWKDRPYVFVNFLGDKNLNTVSSPPDYGLTKAVNYLIEKGHRRIGYFYHEIKSDFSASRRRLDAYLKAVRKFKLDHDPQLHQEAGRNTQDYQEGVSKLLKAKPTAILTDGEYLGGPLSFQLRHFGIKIPDDISLMPYENHFFSQFAEPPLTTIAQNFVKIAELAVDKLLEITNGQNTSAVQSWVDCEIIERKSVKDIRPH